MKTASSHLLPPLSQSLLTSFFMTHSFINLHLLFPPSASPLPLFLFSLPLPSLLGWPYANLRLFPTRWLSYHYIITVFFFFSPLLHPDVTTMHTTPELFQYSCISRATRSPFSRSLCYTLISFSSHFLRTCSFLLCIRVRMLRAIKESSNQLL